MADVFTALVGAIANCIGPENCQKCEYRDIRTKTRCKTMLLRDALELLNAQEPQIVSGWVSVKDRMPENEKIVIGYTPCDGYMFIGFYRTYKSATYEWSDWCIITSMRSTKKITKKVTHWMPLPEAPKEEA